MTDRRGGSFLSTSIASNSQSFSRVSTLNHLTSGSSLRPTFRLLTIAFSGVPASDVHLVVDPVSKRFSSEYCVLGVFICVQIVTGAVLCLYVEWLALPFMHLVPLYQFRAYLLDGSLNHFI